MDILAEISDADDNTTPPSMFSFETWSTIYGKVVFDDGMPLSIIPAHAESSLLREWP